MDNGKLPTFLKIDLTEPRTSIEMDGTLDFDWSHLGGRILA